MKSKQIKFRGDFLAAVKTAPCESATRYHTGRSKYTRQVGAKQAAKLAQRAAAQNL